MKRGMLNINFCLSSKNLSLFRFSASLEQKSSVNVGCLFAGYSCSPILSLFVLFLIFASLSGFQCKGYKCSVWLRFRPARRLMMISMLLRRWRRQVEVTGVL